MRRATRAGLVAALLFFSQPAPAIDLTKEMLARRFSDVAELDADITQDKTSSFLFKPLRSRIHLHYKADEILWSILEPVRMDVVLDKAGMRMTGKSGQTQLVPNIDGGRTATIVRFIKALLTVDLVALEKDFVIRFSGSIVDATPRPGGDLVFLERVTIQFDSNLFPAELVIKAPRESTRLVFDQVRIAYLPSGLSGEP